MASNRNAAEERMSKNVMIRFPESLYDALVAKSKETGAPQSEIIRRAVTERLSKG